MGVLGPVVADEELGGAAAWGFILAAQGVGLVVGGLIGLRLSRGGRCSSRHARDPPLGAADRLGFPLGTLAIAAFAFLAGVGIEFFGVLWDTAMQQEVPPESALARLLLRRAGIVRLRADRALDRRAGRRRDRRLEHALGRRRDFVVACRDPPRVLRWCGDVTSTARATRRHVQPVTSQRRLAKRRPISTSRTTISTTRAAQTPTIPQSNA